MSKKQWLTKNLRDDSRLVERAEIYRGSWPVRPISGVLSILTAGAIYVNDEVTRFLDRTVRPREFAFAWLDVLFITVIIAAWFLEPGHGW